MSMARGFFLLCCLFVKKYIRPGACAHCFNQSCIGLDLWPDDRAVAFDAEHNASFPLTYHSSKNRAGCGAMCRGGPFASLTIEDFMNNGTVKFYNAQKGYGFIAPTNGSKDVFVHATALERAGISSLAEGQKVAFDTAEDRRTGKVSVQNIELA